MNMVERIFYVKLKSVQIDKGGEFSFLDTHIGHLGLNHRVIFLYTSKQNDVVKSRNIRIIDKGHALLMQAHLAPEFWIHSFRIVVYMINRMHICVMYNKSPY